MVFSQDGRRILAIGSDDNTVLLWDLTDPSAPRRLGSPLTGHNGVMRSVAFAPDGRTLATAGDDNTLLLWDLTVPRHALAPRTASARLQRPSKLGYVRPDGRTLITGSNGNEVLLWDLTGLNSLRSQPLRAACARGGGGLDRTTWDLYASEIPYDARVCPG